MYEIHMKNYLIRTILRIPLLKQNKQNRKFLIQNFPIHKYKFQTFFYPLLYK